MPHQYHLEPPPLVSVYADVVSLNVLIFFRFFFHIHRHNFRQAESKEKEAQWALRDRKHESDTQKAEHEWQLENLKAKMATTIAELEGKMAIIARGVERAEHSAEARILAAREREAEAKEQARLARQYSDESLRLKQSQADGHARELTALHAKIAAHDERLVRVQDASKMHQAEYAHSLSARDSELRSLGEKMARY